MVGCTRPPCTQQPGGHPRVGAGRSPVQARGPGTHFSTPVTGGYDSHIRLWNPLFSKKPVWIMKGHQTSVMHILTNSKNSSILVSISMDKVLPSVPSLGEGH